MVRCLVCFCVWALECGSALLCRFGFSFLSLSAPASASSAKGNAKHPNQSGRAKHCRTPEEKPKRQSKVLPHSRAQTKQSWVFARLLAFAIVLCFCRSSAFADPPVASYLFPAGGKRGSVVKVRVGGLNLYDRCDWELLGRGVTASKELLRTRTRWFEGPMLPLPASQRQEDYPSDMTGEVRIAADAHLGVRRGRMWTAEGASAGLAFMVGDLPEVIEEEIDGDAVPVEVKLPVTINGRIYPRENVDSWAFTARTGQVITAEVHAARLGSPLDSRLEVLGPDDRLIAENDDARGSDSLVSFTASADCKYQVRIHDSNRNGGPQFVYRLTITADPYVTGVYPLGGRRGTKTRFTLMGTNLPREPVELSLPATGGDLQRFSVGGKLTNPVAIDIDDLPEVLESEPNDTPDRAQRVTLPVVVNGRIDRPGDVDCWSFAGRKGEMVQLQMHGWRFGSPLRGVIEVHDDAGKALAQSLPQPQPDPSVFFIVPRDGTYVARVRDFFRHRGGPAFTYRLRMAVPAPDFHLELDGQVLSVARGKKADLKLHVRREGGFKGAIALAIDGLPAGVSGPFMIGPGQDRIDLGFTATLAPPIGVSRLTIRGTATIGGRQVKRIATVPGEPGEQPIDRVLLAVALMPPFKVVGSYDLRLAPRGTVFRKHFKIERNGFTGPLEVRLADRQTRHLQGVTGPVLTIPADVNEFDYPVTLPPWMETGRTSRACIMAIGKGRDGGVEHTVSYTSQAQNDQFIAVVETGRLGLEMERGSVAAKRGETVIVPVSIRRGKGLKGPVTIELVIPEHVRGLRAQPLTIAEKQTAGKLVLTFAPEAGPFNMPFVVRATLIEPSGPVTAEANLEIVADVK